MVYYNPRWILVEFLRNRLTDPRARAEAANSNTFTATASQTDFDIVESSGGVSCITSVTVDSIAQTKWRDYYPLYKGKSVKVQKIVFFTALSGGEAVVINYKSGSSFWIFGDKPQEKLNATKFPRVDILTLAGSEKRVGQFNSDMEARMQFQIDVWAKERAKNQIFTIDSVSYAGEELAEYFAWKIKKLFEDFESDMHPALYGYEALSLPRTRPFNRELQCHQKVLELALTSINVGSVE